MGRSIAFRYSVEMTILRGHMTPAGWHTRGYGQIPGLGKPTAERLADYVRQYNESIQPGGCNDHLGQHAKCISARVKDHHTGQIVAVFES